MSIIETKPAAYKGITFLMITSTITGGRKDALFEFPNSGKQKIEDLGLRPRRYRVSAIIPHDNYIEVRDNLLRALEDGIKGPLEHPFYGRIENIVSRSYTITEGISTLGRAELQINFAISDDIGTPQKAQNAISEASVQSALLNQSISADIAADFEVDEGFFGNFQDAAALADDIGDAFDAAVGFATTLTDQINQYASQVNDFTTQVNQLVAIPQDLADSITNLYSTVNGLFGSIEATFDAFTNPTFFDFGDDAINIHQTTQGRVQRAQNRDVLNQSMQTFALGYAYLNAAQIDFQTIEDIDRVNSVLEDQYAKILFGKTVSVEGLASPLTGIQGISPETLTTLTNLRTIANKLLDDKRTEAKKIVTIDTAQMPMSVLAYQYYGNTELADTLLELNAIKGASFIKGPIKILTV